MILTGSLLKSSIEKYKNSHKLKENYSNLNGASSGISAAFNSFLLVTTALFFVLEIFLLYFAVAIAIKCTKGGPERIVHIVMATIFTLPYMLINITFNKCAIDILRS